MLRILIGVKNKLLPLNCAIVIWTSLEYFQGNLRAIPYTPCWVHKTTPLNKLKILKFSFLRVEMIISLHINVVVYLPSLSYMLNDSERVVSISWWHNLSRIKNWPVTIMIFHHGEYVRLSSFQANKLPSQLSNV